MTKQALCVVFVFVVGIAIGAIISPKDNQEFHKYDVNQDGMVTQLDVLHVINYINNNKASNVKDD